MGVCVFAKRLDMHVLVEGTLQTCCFQTLTCTTFQVKRVELWTWCVSEWKRSDLSRKTKSSVSAVQLLSSCYLFSKRFQWYFNYQDAGLNQNTKKKTCCFLWHSLCTVAVYWEIRLWDHSVSVEKLHLFFPSPLMGYLCLRAVLLAYSPSQS